MANEEEERKMDDKSVKEQEIREEISTETADKVSGGKVESLRHNRDIPSPERIKPAVSSPIPSSRTAPAPAPAPAAPSGGTHHETDNINNTNIGGEQKIGNQGRDNRIDGKVNF